MHHFKIDADRIKEFRKPIVIRTGILLVFAVVVGGFLPGLMSDGAASWSNNWILIGLFAAIVPFSIHMSVKRHEASLLSYRLTITDDSIIREMDKTPSITILKKDVREIILQSNGAIAIVGTSKFNAIGVPTNVERKDELTSLLSEVKPLNVKTSASWLVKFQFPITILVIGLLFSSFYFDNKIISAIGIIAFCVLMISAFVVIQKSKHFDRRMKRMSYIMLIPFIAMLYAAIVKLMEW
jgi:hypothetical protein